MPMVTSSIRVKIHIRFIMAIELPGCVFFINIYLLCFRRASVRNIETIWANFKNNDNVGSVFRVDWWDSPRDFRIQRGWRYISSDLFQCYPVQPKSHLHIWGRPRRSFVKHVFFFFCIRSRWRFISSDVSSYLVRQMRYLAGYVFDLGASFLGKSMKKWKKFSCSTFRPLELHHTKVMFTLMQLYIRTKERESL